MFGNTSGSLNPMSAFSALAGVDTFNGNLTGIAQNGTTDDGDTPIPDGPNDNYVLSNPIFTNDVDGQIVQDDGNRDLMQYDLGTRVADAIGGFIDVYIDDDQTIYGSGTSGRSGRSWYDGVGYSLVEFELSITLDIKPGPSNNTVSLNGNGTLQMAILANEEFDVLDVDIASLLFGDPILVDGGATALGATSDKLRDLNHDGLDDLLVGFSISDLVDGGALDASSVEGRLTGLLDGTPFEAMDSIRIVPPNGSNTNSLQISAVPEPTTCTLVLAALCLAISRRRAF